MDVQAHRSPPAAVRRLAGNLHDSTRPLPMFFLMRQAPADARAVQSIDSKQIFLPRPFAGNFSRRANSDQKRKSLKPPCPQVRRDATKAAAAKFFSERNLPRSAMSRGFCSRTPPMETNILATPYQLVQNGDTVTGQHISLLIAEKIVKVFEESGASEAETRRPRSS